MLVFVFELNVAVTNCTLLRPSAAVVQVLFQFVKSQRQLAKEASGFSFGTQLRLVMLQMHTLDLFSTFTIDDGVVFVEVVIFHVSKRFQNRSPLGITSESRSTSLLVVWHLADLAFDDVFNTEVLVHHETGQVDILTTWKSDLQNLRSPLGGLKMAWQPVELTNWRKVWFLCSSPS